MVFKLQFYENVGGKWRGKKKTSGDTGKMCVPPLKQWRLYIGYPLSIYSAELISLGHILHVLRVRRNKQSLK